MTAATQPIEIASEEVGILLSALYDKLTETETYLRSYGETDKPRPSDTCCDYHRARFDERHAQKKSLEMRLDRTQQLITRFEDLERALAHEGNPTA